MEMVSCCAASTNGLCPYLWSKPHPHFNSFPDTSVLFFNKMMLSYLLKETSHLAHLLSHQATAPMYIPLLTLAITNPIIVHVFIPHPLLLPTRIAAVLHHCCCSPFAQAL